VLLCGLTGLGSYSSTAQQQDSGRHSSAVRAYVTPMLPHMCVSSAMHYNQHRVRLAAVSQYIYPPPTL
jgi:hypothetical protein